MGKNWSSRFSRECNSEVTFVSLTLEVPKKTLVFIKTEGREKRTEW